MFSKVIYENDHGRIFAVKDNPNYRIEATANSIAISAKGDIYRKSTTFGSDGWVLICAEGGPAVGEELEGEDEEEEPELPQQEPEPEPAKATVKAKPAQAQAKSNKKAVKKR